MIDIGDRYFMCDECKLCQGWEHRLEDAHRYGYDFQFDHCGCDKVDADFFIGGYCEDAFETKEPPRHRGCRESGRAYRRYMKEIKKNRLYDIVTLKYAPHAGYVDWDYVDGRYVPVGNYIKYTNQSGWQKYLKRYSNKVVRRSSYTGAGKSGYKRCFDYWWALY